MSPHFCQFPQLILTVMRTVIENEGFQGIEFRLFTARAWSIYDPMVRTVGIGLCIVLLLAVGVRDFQHYFRTAPTGYFIEMQYSGAIFPDDGNYSYKAPKNIGNSYSIEVEDSDADIASRSRTWRGIEATSASPRPALVLLHGSGRDGRSMLDMWHDVAKSADLHLIAPDSFNKKGWSHNKDGETFLDAVMADAEAQFNIDPGQIYLFGHSAGGVLALRLANNTEGPWKKVAVHAAYIPVQDIRSNPQAIPLDLYLGENDHLFTLVGARTSGKALSEAGHDVKLIEIKGHTHWLYSTGPEIVKQIWAGLRDSP